MIAEETNPLRQEVDYWLIGLSWGDVGSACTWGEG